MLPQSKLFWALEASAGTGKTFNLAVRFIELILSGAGISQIMALTFTKKAANEMKERIIRNFLDLENQKNELKLIADDLNLSFDEILALRDKKRVEFLNSNLNISTFDSFFNKIIKLFALNCGVDPHFGIDDTILKHQQKIFIDEIIKNTRDFANLINLIANLDAKKDKILANLDYLQENQVEIPNFANVKFLNLDGINSLLDEIVLLLRKNGCSDTGINTFSISDKTINKIAGISALKYNSLSESKNHKKAYTPELDEKFIALKDEIKKYLDELEIYNLSELAKFIKTYKNAKTKFNKTSSKLTYSDVSSLVYDLLCGGKIDTNLLYFRLDSKITHLLIDEFQDTSVSQYKIMHPLISEIVAGAGQNGVGSFFYVGDKKQSIYGFRGAKKELFDALRDEFLQIRTTNLDTNYRSLKLLVKFVNFVFKDKFDGKFVEQKCNNALNGNDLAKSQEYIKNNPNFNLFEIENDDYGYVKSLSSDEIFDEVLNQIAFLRKNGVDDGDITVLCWKNEDCESLKEMLESKGIGVTINSTKKLRSVKEIASIVEYAKFCLSGAKIYERNLNSLLGFTPERESLDFRQNPQILAKKIAKILKIELNNENILLFFEVLSKYKNFIEYIYANDDTNAFSQSSSGVNLMSIHKSKGLEFDHLIVCDLVGGKKHNADNFLINYDTNAKKWQIKYKVSGRENVDSRYSNLKEKLEKIEKDEKINDIYVAFTRAKKSLIIIKKANPNGKSPSYFVPYETGSGNNKVLHDDYLDLGDFEYGFVIPSAPKAITKSAPQKIAFDESIPKQLVSDNESDIDENGESITNYKSQIFGTALHYALEMCEKFDENSLKIALMASKNKFGQFLGIESFENIEKRILNLINSHKFSELLSGAKIYKEVPFKTQDGEFRQIDLLLVKENEAIIIDYKSSKNDEFFEKNRGQVEFYKSSLNQIYPNLQIRGFIAILNYNKTEFYEI